jgi:hypothetical protein
MSRSARRVILTRYSIRSLDLCEKLPGVPHFATFRLFETLADSFAGIGQCCEVEQSLILFRILQYRRWLAFHGQDHRLSGFSDPPDDFSVPGNRNLVIY